MGQFVDTKTRTFTAGAAIGQYLRVKLTAGQLALAGIADREIGTMWAASLASGDPAAVVLRNSQGTTPMISYGPIAVGDRVYAAADGQVSAIQGPIEIGIALTAASATGSQVEVLPTNHEATGIENLVAGGAIAANLRVVYSTGKLAVAGLTAKGYGTALLAAAAEDDVIPIHLLNKPGFIDMVAAGSFSAGDPVYTAASGKISDTQGTGAFLIGIAMEASTGDGDVVAVLPNTHGDEAGS